MEHKSKVQEFREEVIDRLARIETKLHIQWWVLSIIIIALASTTIKEIIAEVM